MRRLSAAFPVVLLSLLAALSFWLESKVQPPSAPRDGSERHDPDYIVENFRALRLGPDGEPRYQLAAPRMVHFPDDDSTHLEHPHLTQFDPKRAPITVTSGRALVSGNGEVVEFFDAVRIVRSAYARESELTVTTEYLRAIPEKHLAQTDKAVRLQNASGEVNAVGLELNTEERVMTLLSNVRGTYVQPK